MKKMMKSLAFNAIILYLLFKTPVSELILARLPPNIASLQSFKQLSDALAGLAWKGSRMSRRMTAVVVFLVGLMILKKIWQHLRATEFLAYFVEKYLCDGKVKVYQTYDKNGSPSAMHEGEGKHSMSFNNSQSKRGGANSSTRLDQPRGPFRFSSLLKQQ